MATYARTHKPKTDETKAERSARKRALLKVAAKRMGYESWSTFEAQIRRSLEQAETNGGVSANLHEVLSEAEYKVAIIDGFARSAPTDVLAALAAHPKKQRAG